MQHHTVGPHGNHLQCCLQGPCPVDGLPSTKPPSRAQLRKQLQGCRQGHAAARFTAGVRHSVLHSIGGCLEVAA